ncbi:MAG: DUF3179 domain-containing protein [Acidimicrobiia bacterium]|nr:DUF3179 domain-containing protein [Acidimicrobiia bacterium]
MFRGLPIVAVVLALVAAACASGGATTQGRDDAATAAGPTALAVAYEGGLSNDHPDFATPLIDVTRVAYGLQAPDLIPSVDQPTFSTIEEIGDWLPDEEAVVIVTVGEQARAYPVRILISHEIVNDEIDGTPVAVTYCPLCNSALAFVSIVDGRPTTFGVSGMLFNSALIMYDRETESLWLHYTGEAVVGERVGDQLERVPASLVSWAEFKENHPEGMVLDSADRGRYGGNAYANAGSRGAAYDTLGSEPFLFNGITDPRAQSMQRVAGVALDGEATAWTLSVLAGGAATVTDGVVGNQPVVVFWTSGQSSALAGREINSGVVVGSTGVFLPVVDGVAMEFDAEGDHFVDRATSSTWNIEGVAVSGPLEGTALERVPHVDSFWFAWSSYWPETKLVTIDGTLLP